MKYVYAAFVIFVFLLFLMGNGTFPTDPESADPAILITGMLLLVIVGVLVFRVGIWAERFGKVFEPQKVAAKTDKTPFQVMYEALRNLALILLFVSALIVFQLENSGHHEELIRALQFLESRFTKLINVFLP